MTVVTIKKVNWKTSVPKKVLKNAVRVALEKHGRPKSIVVRSREVSNTPAKKSK